MGVQAYLVVVAVGSALVGLWAAVRWQRFAPTSGRGAGLCLLLAWLVPGLIRPAFAASLLQLRPAFALLVSVFPLFVLTFALTAWGLRYLAGLLGHAAR